MADYLSDLTVWVYVLTMLISIYGAGLFGWWWIKKGAASSVFAYVTFIFVGESIDTGVALYARTLHVRCLYAEYAFILDSLWWSLRGTVVLASLCFIVVHMSWRAFRNVPRGERRRETD